MQQHLLAVYFVYILRMAAEFSSVKIGQVLLDYTALRLISQSQSCDEPI
jgi:hypothetical protein